MSARLEIVEHPLLQHRLAQLRNQRTAPEQFRTLLRMAGALLTYEAARSLPTQRDTVRTPLADAQVTVLREVPVLVAVLRAGLGMLDGALRLFPEASVGHVGLYRDPRSLQAVEYYFKVPQTVRQAPVFVFDPMLATGNSAVAALQRLQRAGARELHLVTLVAAPQGIRQVREQCPEVPITTAAVDERLDERGYIVPGLGDAGDRFFGTEHD